MSDVLDKWEIEIGDCRGGVGTMHQEPLMDCVAELADALNAAERRLGEATRLLESAGRVDDWNELVDDWLAAQESGDEL